MLYFVLLLVATLADVVIYFFTRCLMFYVAAMVYLALAMLINNWYNRISYLLSLGALTACLVVCLQLDRLYGGVMVDYRLLAVQQVVMMLLTVAEFLCPAVSSRELAAAE